MKTKILGFMLLHNTFLANNFLHKDFKFKLIVILNTWLLAFILEICINYEIISFKSYNFNLCIFFIKHKYEEGTSIISYKTP